MVIKAAAAIVDAAAPMIMLRLHISVRSSMLFDLWNAFENRLPADFMQAKILEVGDLLFSMQVFYSVICTQ